MSKYLCLCGQGFRKKKKADDHILCYKDIDLHWPHQILKKNWRVRILESALNFPWANIFGVFGGWLLFQVIAYHFKIDFNNWEAALIGLSIGLILK